MKTFNRTIGTKKEDNAVEYITKVKKYRVLERNYTTKIGEIDIIAIDKDKRIIFVEVKYRSTAKYGFGRESVNYYKINKIRNVALQYLRSTGSQDRLVRFDVIDILDDRITYIENAF